MSDSVTRFASTTTRRRSPLKRRRPSSRAVAPRRRGKSAPEENKVAAFPASRARSWRRGLSLAAALLVFAGLAGWWAERKRLARRLRRWLRGSSSFSEAAPNWRMRRRTRRRCATGCSLTARQRIFIFRRRSCRWKASPAAWWMCDGRKTYLSCYWRENKPDRGDHELIHLLVGRRSDFKDAPSSAQPQRRELDGWSFASWSEGDVVYTLATAAPPEKLTPFLAWAGAPRILALAH